MITPVLTRTKRGTILNNFEEIHTNLSVPVSHFMDIIFDELKTTGNLNGRGELDIRGSFDESQVIDTINEYVKKYCTCPECHSESTTYHRDHSTRTETISCFDCSHTHSLEKRRRRIPFDLIKKLE